MRVHVPRGGWLRRTDDRDDIPPNYPVLAYGLDDGILIICKDGQHKVASKEETFPASNWEVWVEIESV